jgi:hypothetical protein
VLAVERDQSLGFNGSQQVGAGTVVIDGDSGCVWTELDDTPDQSIIERHRIRVPSLMGCCYETSAIDEPVASLSQGWIGVGWILGI